MKKLAMLCFAVASVFSVRAQIQFGVKAGMNFSKYTYHYTPSPDRKTKINFNAGVLADIPLFSTFYLQPEIMYSGEGYDWSNDSLGDGGLSTQNINVPVLLKYQHRSGLFAETGPQIGFLISESINLSGQNIKTTGDPLIHFSWAFGLGYKLRGTNLGIDARYNLDLSNIYKKNNAGDYEIRNVFQIGLFYLFGKN